MRLRIALAAVPVVVLVWLGIGIYLVQSRNAIFADAEQDSRVLAHGFEENIRRTIAAIDTTIRAIRAARAADPAHFDLATWERESGLTRELTMQISLADRSGNIIVSDLAGGRPRANIADREHFRASRDMTGDTLFISLPVIGRVSHRWSVQFVRKLSDPTGAFDGVIVASLDPAFLARFYQSLDLGRAAMLLLGRDGVVRSVGPETVAALGDDLSTTPLGLGVSGDANGTVTMRATSDGVERAYSWRRLDLHGLVAVVGLSTDDMLIGYRQELKGSLAIGLGLTVAIGFVSALFDRSRRDVVLSREMLRAAVENISQGLMVIDSNRRVPLLNARAAELLELPPQLAFPGVEFDSLLEWQLDGGEFAGNDAAAARVLAESGGIERGNHVYRRTRRNGTVLEIRTKVLDTGLVVRTFADVTEQERTAKILADARDAAEAAAQTRSELLAVMSHEIRTPLNGVLGVATLLEDMELGPAQRDYVRMIRRSGDHLLELINDILDFSRLEAERVELEEVDFAPREQLQRVAEMFVTQARTKGLHLTAIADDDVPAMVIGDPGRLRQILLNLVGNAVKFTDRGYVSLTLMHEPAPDGRVKLLFKVADSGIGIAPEATDRMFREFTQVDGSISRRFGGSGLGLAICRRLVELMGGSIGVTSQPGQGSTFSFDVTLRPGRAIPPAAANVQALAEPGIRILLAEDNPTNRLVAVRMLEQLGCRVESVGNGLEAVVALEGNRHDLVLMDVMMPEMDGLEACRHIRAMGGDQARIAIVGLTAGSGPDDMGACREAGMDAVTTKPITPARLNAAIAEGLKAAGDRLATTAQERGTSRLRALTQALGEDAVAEIVATFTEDTKANLEVMKQAAGCNDNPTVYRCAHGVAGAARNVGADDLATLASALEQTVGSLSAAQIAMEIAAMQTALNAVLGHLRQGAEQSGATL